MNRLEMEVMYGEKAPITEKTIDNMFLTNGIPLTHIARSNAKTTMSMKELCDMIQGVMFDEFMKISENDMTELRPEVISYCEVDVLATRNVKKALNEAFGVERETAEEKKERERESYLKYKEFVMKKKGHKGGFR